MSGVGVTNLANSINLGPLWASLAPRTAMAGSIGHNGLNSTICSCERTAVSKAFRALVSCLGMQPYLNVACCRFHG